LTGINNQKHSGRHSRRKGPSVIFNIQQWERQTASIKRQRSIPSILTASLHQWELFIHHSVIHYNHEVYHCDAAISAGNMGRHMEYGTDFITQSGKCNSITGQPQQSYKWECEHRNCVASS
jgi:hypothetical protein